MSRVAVQSNGAQHLLILSALHFELEKRSLEEVLMRVKKQSEILKREHSGQKIFSIFQVYDETNSRGQNLMKLSDILNMELWSLFPQEISNVGLDFMMKSIARCIKRQIHWINIIDKEVITADIFGSQFHQNTTFYLVNFIYNSKLSCVVTATEIQN